ncbi:helix-turn-helix domain-containing protein [Streptomyces sp. NPDC059611]|uniref:helix-turn-helix domain-containing protein n=1 Tax=Streptomyces sp. NPDC059611 TaxID=3346884 RepID=UPI003684CF26
MPGRSVHVTGPARLKLGAELKKAYTAGTSVRTLEHSCGRSYGFVHRLLTEAGITLRTRGGRGAARRAKPSRVGPKRTPLTG